eukprot:CAMPEP_0198327282 /NCGR_PEP_ID=MMETSP1450-20131203/14582_1 /TAXON_ID=753684 ORGANISM="Madagascaria erythrocladiodes, Strain CCMP3234" /NCGR_SAMPLE_ID=MMETSP1450 /ASSEMBLY_ACC=CAM_ASM_001115 /LENGTH=143 /DNA_ID=CAMNT_0044031321 /DNA_START=32 /DNA_END=460 /DNA_ORIENTATION=-
MASITDLERYPFFFNASRDRAENLLRGQQPRVCIVRPSTQVPGAVSVSWSEPDRIKHSLIEIIDGWYVTEVEDGSSLKFGKIETLLDFLKLIPYNSARYHEGVGYGDDSDPPLAPIAAAAHTFSTGDSAPPSNTLGGGGGGGG